MSSNIENQKKFNQKTWHITLNPNNKRDRKLIEFFSDTEFIYPETTQVKNFLYEYLIEGKTNYNNDNSVNDVDINNLNEKNDVMIKLLKEVLELVKKNNIDGESIVTSKEKMNEHMEEILKGI